MIEEDDVTTLFLCSAYAVPATLLYLATLLTMMDVYALYFVLFHVMFDLRYFEKLGYDVVSSIESVHEILFDSVLTIRAIQESVTNADIGSVITSFVVPNCHLPVDGSMDDVNLAIKMMNNVDEANVADEVNLAIEQCDTIGEVNYDSTMSYFSV